MGKYLSIQNAKTLENQLKLVYSKHCMLNIEQFKNDFGDVNNFNDTFVFNSKDNTFELKLGVLDRNFFTDEFISDVYKVIYENNIKIKKDTSNIIEGITYYNIEGIAGVRHVKVLKNIKVGDIFNMYCFESTKYGVKWKGDLKKSIIDFVSNKLYQEELKNTLPC